MPLDYATIHLCNSLLNVSYGLILLIVWIKRREVHYLLWSSSLVLVSAAVWGFTLANTRWEIAVLLGCVAANVTLIWGGLRAFDGRQAFKPYMMATPIFVTVAFWMASSALGQPGLARAISTTLMGINVLSAGAYLRSKPHERGLGRSIVACALLAYVPVYALSTMMSLAGYNSETAGNVILVADFALDNIFVIGLFVLTEDRTRRKLQELATIDPLTGAYNRGGFLDHIKTEFRGRPIALLTADLDHFKHINDTYGHAGGDAVLVAFVAAVRRELSGGELIGRLGGEEFAIVLPGYGHEAAKERAERIRQDMDGNPVLWDGMTIQATVSVGLAVRSLDEPLEATLRRSDEALYRAKHQGRNRIAA